MKLQPESGPRDNRFFIMGVLLGSACGLVVGSALGFELRPDNLRTLRKMMRRLSGQQNNPHYDVLV